MQTSHLKASFPAIMHYSTDVWNFRTYPIEVYQVLMPEFSHLNQRNIGEYFRYWWVCHVYLHRSKLYPSLQFIYNNSFFSPFWLPLPALENGSIMKPPWPIWSTQTNVWCRSSDSYVVSPQLVWDGKGRYEITHHPDLCTEKASLYSKGKVQTRETYKSICYRLPSNRLQEKVHNQANINIGQVRTLI